MAWPGFGLMLVIPLYVNGNRPSWVNSSKYSLSPVSSINNRKSSTYCYLEDIFNLCSISAPVQADPNIPWACSLSWRSFNSALGSMTFIFHDLYKPNSSYAFLMVPMIQSCATPRDSLAPIIPRVCIVLLELTGRQKVLPQSILGR